MKEKKIVVIDGNLYLHRAYHAIPSLTDAHGNIVNAVFGFVKMLKKIITKEKPTHIFVAFDHPKPTFRHMEFKSYKANRKETDADLIRQIPKVFKILDVLKIKYIDFEGYEADDIIATFTRLALKEKLQVAILTGDKDALQLIKDNVKVVNDIKNIDYDEEKVKEKIGVMPNQIVDYLALIGDKSDNLPGVMGIGPVTARKLLEEFNDLDEIYNNLGRIKSSTSEKLIRYKEDAYNTRKLVKLVENIELPITVRECLWKGPDHKKLRERFNDLNFKSLITDWIGIHEVRNRIPVNIIRSQDELKKYLDLNMAKNKISIELVFKSEEPGTDFENLTGLGIGFDEKNIIYIPIGHSYPGVGNQLKLKEVKNIFNSCLYKKDRFYLAYDFKKIYKFFKKQNIKFDNKYFDVITADYILNSETGEKGLKSICSKYLDWAPNEISNNHAEENIEQTAGKVTERLMAVFRLSEILLQRIIEQKEEKLFNEVEIPVLKILAEMEMTGIKIDTEDMRKTEKEFKKELSGIEKDIFSISGEKFNINSSKKLAQILFDKLGLEAARRTKTGYSTAEDVLNRLALTHPLPVKILDYRKLHKLLSTYVEPLPAMTEPETSRVHTTFHITGTATGRLSSSDPNLQNIPVKTSRGSLIRRAFIPEKENLFLSADYSQIDLRVLAHISCDKNLIDSFNKGEDIHSITAANIFDIDESEVTEEFRKKAKQINFGIIYGMSPWGLSKKVDMSEYESREFIEKYFRRYPGIEGYVKETLSKARKDKYVTTILNRRRYLPEINSSNYMRRMLFERMAINTPIQGSSADVIKVAMVKLNEEFHFNDGPVKLLLQIHDELLFEIPRSDIEYTKGKIKEKMENAVELAVPLIIDFKTGSNWMELIPC